MSVITLGSITNRFSNTLDADGNFNHTVTTGTELLILAVCIEGNENPQGTVAWDSAGVNETFTLIHDTGSTGSNGDVRALVYGLLNPTAKTAQIDYNWQGSARPSWLAARNYDNVDTSGGVAGATNFLTEDVNTAVTNTAVHASGGTAGNALVMFGAGQGGDMSPAAQTAGTTFTEVVDSNTGGTGFSDFGCWYGELLDAAPSAITLTWGNTDENTSIFFEIVAAATSITASGAPSINKPTSSGVAEVQKQASGAPSISAITSSGVSVVQKQASGAPSISAITSAGSAAIQKQTSGAPSINAITSAGTIKVTTHASGSPSISQVTSAGVAEVQKQAFGAPSINAITSAGVSVVQKQASGAPSISAITSAGSSAIQKQASGAPSISKLTSAGVTVVQKQASGAPSISAVISSGSASVLGAHSASGSPTIKAIISSGSATLITVPSVELRGGDSSKRRLLMPDERLYRQLKREDDEILSGIIASMENMNE